MFGRTEDRAIKLLQEGAVREELAEDASEVDEALARIALRNKRALPEDVLHRALADDGYLIWLDPRTGLAGWREASAL
jgi:hypothetical protein